MAAAGTGTLPDPSGEAPRLIEHRLPQSPGCSQSGDFFCEHAAPPAGRDGTRPSRWSVEFHLDKRGRGQPCWPGWNPALQMECRVPPRQKGRRGQPRWPGWNPAVQYGMSSSTSTKGGEGNAAGRDGTRPSRWSVEFHLDKRGRGQPRWPGWNPAVQWSVEFHLDKRGLLSYTSG